MWNTYQLNMDINFTNKLIYKHKVILTSMIPD